MVDGQKRASVETTGVSVTEAIAEGLAALEVELDEVDVEVLAEPSRGLFGLGSRDARVRVSIKPPVDESAPPEPPPAARAPIVPAPRPVAVQPVELAPVPQPEPAPAPPPEASPEVTDLVGTAQEVTAELLALMGIEGARIDVRDAELADDETDAPLLIDIKTSGEELIGRQGETLNALQHITRLIIGREKAGRRRILVDVNGYRARRDEKLRTMAQRLAQQAVDTDRTIVLEPMPPAERRIVHLALRDHKDVTTQSIGEGDRRKVTIVPNFD